MRALIILCFLFNSFLANADLVSVVKKIKPSVVGIGVYTPTSRPQNQLFGSGFAIGNGQYVVTNHHVMPEVLDIELNQKMAVFVGVGIKAQVRKAEIVAKDSVHDLAILKISGKPLPAMALGNDDFYPDASDIAFTGFPIGSILGLYPVTHRGMISAVTPVVVPAADAGQINLAMLKRMRNPYMVYQLDAVAYPGNSGSAMYDTNSGDVVGIINKVFIQRSKEGAIENPSGITYAIPVRYLRKLLKDNNIAF